MNNFIQIDAFGLFFGSHARRIRYTLQMLLLYFSLRLCEVFCSLLQVLHLQSTNIRLVLLNCL